MASVSIRVNRGDGLAVEFDADDGMTDPTGRRTWALLNEAIEKVRAGLRGAEPTEAAPGGES